LLFAKIRYVIEELKFVKSLTEAGYLAEKFLYILPRVFGTRNPNQIAPAGLQMEPTNFCNSDCICCSGPRSTRERGIMPVDLFRAITDQAAAAGTRRIHLYLHGEPFLHPAIIEMIRYIKSSGLALHITTNGMLLDGLMADDVLRSALTSADHLIFSILGSSLETHENTMRGIDHDRVLKNIAALMEKRSALGLNGPVLETIFYATPENAWEQGAFTRFWRGKVDHVRIGTMSESFRANMPSHLARRKPCSIVLERMAVFWNGDVTWCCADVDGRNVIGNLHTRSLTELWNAPELLRVRRMHKNGRYREIPSCSHCDM